MAAQDYPKAAKYKDFRKMIDKEGKNLDAVMIAIPDHSHTLADAVPSKRLGNKGLMK